MKEETTNKTETLQIRIAPMVKELLDPIKNRVLKHDQDYIFVMDGEEGVGKSVLAQQIASYLDPEFNIDKIVFNATDFMNMIKSPRIKKGSCIVLDEAFSAANNRASLTEVNRAMIGIATEMRQRNLFVIMVLPSFFDLDKYFALWRCKCLFHLYFDDRQQRNYLIFPKEHKKMLYLNGKRTYNYSKPKSPFPPFTFNGTYAVDEKDYRQKKAEAFNKRTVSNAAKLWLMQRNAFIRYIYDTLNISQEDICRIPINYGVKSLDQKMIQRITSNQQKFI